MPATQAPPAARPTSTAQPGSARQSAATRTALPLKRPAAANTEVENFDRPAGANRPTGTSRSAGANRANGASSPARANRPPAAEAEILFQQFFKSVGPRTYAAQLKRAGNGNHFLVLTEGKRDEKTDEVRKTRLFVFSEDFAEFFGLVKEAADFVATHPVPEEVRRKRENFWKREAKKAPSKTSPDARTPAQVPNRPEAARGGAVAKP